MVQYYIDIWPRQSHILDPLTEVDISPKGIKILWNDALEYPFKGLKRMVSDEIFLSYPDWTIPFMAHTDASDKQFVAVISQNNKHMALFSRSIRKSQNCIFL